MGGWYDIGGMYKGHNNHGDCHGSMNNCIDGWTNVPGGGHICTFINSKDKRGMWWNYGVFSPGMYTTATAWVRPTDGEPSQDQAAASQTETLRYHMKGRGQGGCESGLAITTKAECAIAARALGWRLDHQTSVNPSHIDCFITHDRPPRNIVVWAPTSQKDRSNPGGYFNAKYEAICRTPAVKRQHVIRVSNTHLCSRGSWSNHYAFKKKVGGWDYQSCKDKLATVSSCSKQWFAVSRKSGRCYCVQKGDNCDSRKPYSDIQGLYHVVRQGSLPQCLPV